MREKETVFIDSVPFVCDRDVLYKFSKDLIYHGTADAIILDSDGIEIDMDGHFLHILNGCASPFTIINRENIVIRNGTLKSNIWAYMYGERTCVHFKNINFISLSLVNNPDDPTRYIEAISGALDDTNRYILKEVPAGYTGIGRS